MITKDSINRLMASLRARLVKVDGSHDSDLSSSDIKKRQGIMLVSIIVAAIALFFVISYLMESFSDNSAAAKKTATVFKKNNIKIEVADETLKSEKLWINFFEDKLDDTRESLEKKLVTTQESIQKTESKLEKQTVDTITEMTEQLRLAKEELEAAMSDIRAFREERDAELENRGSMLPSLAEVASFEIESHDIYSEVRNVADYIP